MSAPLEVMDVGLAYRMSRNRVGTLKEHAINLLKRQLSYEDFWALQDISFTVEEGEVFAVIGPNGAGKSTLMKIIARVLPPTKGRVIARGVVAPMIELGAGFNVELTAYENIILYGTMLGRQPKDMRRKVPDIIEWAGLEDFVDVPIRSFSSGMLARLGFAVATDTQPRLLVVDEVLSVGDENFQRRCEERIAGLQQDGTAIVLVTHNLGVVKSMADRVMWIQKGRLMGLGAPDDIVEQYRAARS